MSNTLAVGVNGNAETFDDRRRDLLEMVAVGLSGHSTGVVKVANATWTTGQTLTIGVKATAENFTRAMVRT